jgi:hypothetical protein
VMSSFAMDMEHTFWKRTPQAFCGLPVTG